VQGRADHIGEEAGARMGSRAERVDQLDVDVVGKMSSTKRVREEEPRCRGTSHRRVEELVVQAHPSASGGFTGNWWG
jgi:hypothetical protein